MTDRISALQARRIALAAQGFTDPRPTGRIDTRHIRRVVDRMGLLQLDSVNVFCRSHYLPVLARLGPYPRELLDRLSSHQSSADEPGAGRPNPRRRELVEYWAHEASLLPVQTYPLLRWRMDRVNVDSWGRMAALARDQPELIDEVLAQVAQSGPLRSGDTGFVRAQPVAGQMWNWHQGKVALEYLFWAGRVMASRRVNFERWYDLPERVLPASMSQPGLPAGGDLSVAQQQRELVRIAARALGVATEPDLGDYFRLPRAESKQRVGELVEAGELTRVDVAGWSAPAYLWPAARRPRRVAARALLSPFDPLIWFRDRAQRLFGFRYRIEIYVPAAQRVHGYYVLPFLLGESLVARVDLKSDRANGVLLVQSVFAEPGVDRAHVAVELAAELASTAAWLGLASVSIRPRGDLSSDLAAAVG